MPARLIADVMQTMKTNDDVTHCGYWSISIGVIVGVLILTAIISIQRNPLPLNALHLGIGLAGFIVGARLGAERYAKKNTALDPATARAIGQLVGLVPSVACLAGMAVFLYAEWAKGA